jgi:hypothetical protein
MYVAYLSGLTALRKGASIAFSIFALFLLSVAGVLVLLLVLVVLAGVGLRRLRPHQKEPKLYRPHPPPRLNLSEEPPSVLYNSARNQVSFTRTPPSEPATSPPRQSVSITITPPSEPAASPPPRRPKTPLFTLTPRGRNVVISGLKLIHLKWAFDGIFSGLGTTREAGTSMEDESLSDIIIHGNTKKQ